MPEEQPEDVDKELNLTLFETINLVTKIYSIRLYI